MGGENPSAAPAASIIPVASIRRSECQARPAACGLKFLVVFPELAFFPIIGFVVRDFLIVPALTPGLITGTGLRHPSQ